jgi:hypothetical protein
MLYKQTCTEKFGAENAMQNTNIKQKHMQSVIDLYGVKSVSQLPDFICKSKATNKNRYGNENYNNPDKYKKTCLEKFGVENPMQDKLIFEKSMQAIKRAYPIKLCTTKFNDVVSYQSNAELDYIKECDKLDIRILNGNRLDYYHNNVHHLYFVDFKIKDGEQWRLIEIKSKHIWWQNDLKTGLAVDKIRAAVEYSKLNNYLPFKIKFY